MCPWLLATLLLVSPVQQPAPATAPATVIARAQLHDTTGWRFLAQGQYEDAVREFAAALRINADFADALHGMGKAYMALRRYDLAAAAYERCRQAYEKSGTADAESRTLRNRERDARLRDLRQEVFNLQNSPQPEPNETIAKMVSELQVQIRALEGQREPGPAIEPPAPVPAFLSLALGSAYFHLNRVDDAERMFRDAIAAEPRFGEAHSNLALVLLVTGRPREAQQHVAIAEEAGFAVNPELKARIRAALSR
jgi:tetratricopeptide (TPR) repeat protein